MNLNLNLENAIESCEAHISELTERLNKLPQEKIYSRYGKGRYRYYLRKKDPDGKVHEKYLAAAEGEFIKGCCEAAYLRKLISALEAETHALRRLEKGYRPEAKIEAWENLPQGFKGLVEPKFSTKSEIHRAWEYASFESNPFPRPDDNGYVSKKGEVVRSRIELIVANMLYDMGIPYRYECKLRLPSGNLYPDFTILHPEALTVHYIEIFGMMDNDEYERSAFAKIAKYASSDVYPKLIMFFDRGDAPLSPANIKRTLQAAFSAEKR